MRQSDGSFLMHKDGEVDIRGVYCALAVASLTNVLSEDLVRGTFEWIIRFGLLKIFLEIKFSSISVVRPMRVVFQVVQEWKLMAAMLFAVYLHLLFWGKAIYVIYKLYW